MIFSALFEKRNNCLKRFKGSKRLFLSLQMLLFATIVLAQTGPGGVGNSDGSDGQPQNVIWYAADFLSLLDTDPVPLWSDLSGNGNDATQGTVAAQPQFRTGQINGLPALVFDGADDFMPFDGSLIVNSSYTVIFVGARQSNNYQRVFLGGTTSSANQNLHIYWNNSSQFRAHHYGNDLQTDMVSNTETYSAGTDPTEYGIFTTLLSSSDASDNRRNYQNNYYLSNTDPNADSPTQLSTYNGAALGRYNTGYHDVNAAEIIIFANALNDAQLQIVYEYLGNKYGITIYNDIFSPTAGYSTEIIGIGEEMNGEQSEAASSGLYLTALSGLNVGDYIFAANNNAANSSTDFSTADLLAGTEERYNKIWYVDTVGTPAAQIAFDFSEAVTDGMNPTNITNYQLLYRAGTSGNFSIVKSADGIKNGDQVYFDLTDVDLNTGYYTFATSDSVNSPLEGIAGRTWYTLISGNWDDWEVWTLDPSGSLPNNPDQYTPTTSPTNTADDVVILTGRTVIDTSDNLTHNSIIIDGRLDLTTSSGHSFGEIRGTGRVLMAADNFPSGDASHFYTEGQGEGTVVYYGDSYDLSTAREFYDVEIELDGTGDTVTLVNDYTINGKFTITAGNLKINDDTDDQLINLSVAGDVLVSANTGISVGIGNPFATAGYTIGGTMPVDNGENYHDIYHQFVINGNFTNRGVVRFTNQNAPDYNSFATNGGVTVRFEEASNAEVNLYNTTDFYNLVIEKGTDKTYKVKLYADNTSYFTLFGANNTTITTGAPFSTEDPQNRKALFIYKGTLQLTGNIYIPTLGEGGRDFSVGKSARLWMDGSNVTVYSTASAVDQITGYTSSDTYTANGVTTGSGSQAMTVYGEFKITDGYFGTRNSAGFIFWPAANAQVKIEGGECYVSQMRSAGGGGGIASYIQTGGVVTAFGNSPGYGEYTGTFPLFGLESEDAVFQMSGGEIILQDDDGNTDPEFQILSSEGNYSVTGGKITIDVPDTRSVQVLSTANFWDLEITNTSGSGNMTVELDTTLRVGNDLYLDNFCTLEVTDPTTSIIHDVSVGRDFSIIEGATYNFQTNTTTFDGTEDGELYIGYNTDDGYEQHFNNIVVNKPVGNQILVLGDANKEPPNASQHFNRLVHVEGDLSVISGTLNQGRQSVRLYGEVNVRANGVLGIYEAGVTDLTAYIMLKDDGTSGTDIITETGAEFGNLKLNPGNGNTVSISSDVHIKRIGFYSGRMNIGSNKLRVDYLHRNETLDNFAWNNGSVNKMIFSDGNASDGGIEIYIPADTPDNTLFAFPLGTETDSVRYTPIQFRLTSVTDSGYIQVRPVDAELKTTDLTGGDLLDYYWRVSHSVFGAPPTVDRLLLYYDDYDIVGDTSLYVPGKVLDEDPYTRSNINNMNLVRQDLGRINFNDGFVLENANYTAGASARFVGAPEVYYTRGLFNAAVADWTTNTNWTIAPDDIDLNGTIDSYELHDSRQPAASDYPQEGDIAVVGWVPYGDPNYTDGYPHGIEVASAVDFAELRFSQMLDANDGDPTNRKYSYNFQFRPTICINPGGSLNGSVVAGEGMFWLRSAGGTQVDPDFSLVDFGGFIAEDSAYFAYESTSSAYIYNNVPATVPNLLIAGNGWGAVDRDFEISTDVEVLQDFELLGDVNLVLSSGDAGDFIVRNDLVIFRSNANGNDSGGNGEIAFPNDTSRTMEVFGDVRLINNQAIIQVRNPNNANQFEHQLIVYGNLYQDNTSVGGLQLFTATDEDYISLTLTGSGSHNSTIMSGANSSFYNLTINKGADITSSFTFNNSFTLNGPTLGANVSKALELQNGTLVLNNAGIDIDLTTGDEDFEIPSTAQLEVRQGKVNVYGDNTGILIDGKLLINGGTVDMINGAGNGNNYIEYSASGNAEIEISSGSLYVGSQIRRSLDTEEGIITFNQSGGNVQIGVNAGGDTDRSIFEILNAGSSFTHSGGEFHLVNDYRAGASIASMYYNPETSSLSASTEIYFGDTNTTAGNGDFTLYAGQSLMNVVVDSVNSPTLTLDVVPLTLTEDLKIKTSAEFDANGLDLNLNRDFINRGTFTSNTNNTYFFSGSNQEVIGNTTYWNLHKTGSGLLTLKGNVDVDNELHLETGSFNDGDSTLSVQGNVWMDITHTWGGNSNGVLFNGSEEQVLTGSGTFGKLSINNSAGVSLPEGSVVTIDEALQLESGVLDIGKNLLNLNESAIIIEESAFSETNMIQTNISFTDAGVKKFYPAIIPADNYSFIYPIGSEGKYTPVELDISGMDAGGDIRVKGANEIHPTIVNDDEPCNEIIDSLNVLKYHWLMEATGVTGFTADVSMEFYPDDYQENSIYYDVSDYIAARLLFNSTLWNKYDPASFDEANSLLRFNFSNSDVNGISGDYTAGIEDQAGTCEGAIPDEVPAYITISNGDWTDGSIWDTYPTPGGTVPSGGPRGAIAIVQDTVDIPSDYILSYKTTISSTGMLKVGTTFGHRLGIVEGTGTLQLESGSMPAGIYDDFFGVSGGTIEFTGTDSYDVLSEVTTVKNLKFTGTGERRLPNLDFEVYGLLTIAGDDATLNVINEHDRNVTLDSNVVFTQGSFDAGVGSSTVILNGDENQTITGDFSGSNAFWNLEMNNASGVTLAGNIDVDNVLNFISGIITSSAANILTINNSAESTAVIGYGSSNYVDGPMRKLVNSGDAFIFPVGDATRYGQVEVINTATSSADYWEAEYYNSNPHASMDTSSREANLEMVSGNEYWRVAGPSGDSSYINLRWDNQSALPAMTTDRVNNLKIVEWSGTEWQVVEGTVSDGGVNSGSIVSNNRVDLDEHFFTIGTYEPTPLPTATFVSVDTIICPSGSASLVVELTGTANWEIDVSVNGGSSTTYSVTTSPYTLTPNVTAAGTYSIVAVREDIGGTNRAGTVFGSDVILTVITLPTDTYSITPSGTQSYCAGGVGTTISLSDSDIGVNYQLLRDGTAVGSQVAGTNSALSFGIQTLAGTYTIEATDVLDISSSCSVIMTGSLDLSVDALPTANDQTPANFCSELGGENTSNTIDLTALETSINGGAYTYTWYHDAALTIPVVAPGPSGEVITRTINGGASTSTVYYFCEVDDGTCTNTATVRYTIIRTSQTGPTYHIDNGWGN